MVKYTKLEGGDHHMSSFASATDFDETFAIVRDVICDVLGIQSVEPTDNFFDIGGHSITAMRVISRLRARIEPSLPLGYIFDAEDLGGLARLVIACQASGGAAT